MSMQGQEQEGAALLVEDGAITIEGRRHELQPLGIDAVAPIARMLQLAGERAGVKPEDFLLKSEDGRPALGPDGQVRFDYAGAYGLIVRVILAAFGWCQAEVHLLLSQRLGVTQEELRDPRRFPLSCAPQLAAAIASSIDFSAFLAGGLAASSSTARAASDSPSPVPPT